MSTFLLNGGIFRCPVCEGELVREGSSLLCEKRHTFDIASAGYVNLLRTSKAAHGDNKEMVIARRKFLEKGYYSHLKEALAQAVHRYAKKGNLLDSGCGEGYYTEALAKDGISVYGIDISSKAATYSAKKKSVSGVAVASAYELPVKSESCSALTSVFAPFSAEEFCRVLEKDGYFFNVIPAEDHLFELKAAIYDTPYPNTLSELAVEGFRFVEKIPARRMITLDSTEDIATLLMMTPYFYRTSREGHARAQALTSLTTAASFYILVYQKI